MKTIVVVVLILGLLQEIQSFVHYRLFKFNAFSVFTFSAETSGKGFGNFNVKKNKEPDTGTKLLNLEEKRLDSSESVQELSELLVKPNDNDDMLISNTKMFKEMRKKRILQLDQKIKEIDEEERLMATDPSVGAVPELIADRMIKRITAFFGVPVFGGLSIFVGAFFLSKKYDLTVPPAIIAYATQVPFIFGLVGISYAILSTSWDETPGSFFGIDEFKINFDRVKEGLGRTRKNAELRDEIEKEKQALKREIERQN